MRRTTLALAVIILLTTALLFDARAQIIPITPGETKTNSIVSAGEQDFYSFFGTAGDTVTILMGAGSSSLDPRVELQGPNGALASEVASFGGSASIHLENLPQDGTYFIVCRSRFGTPTGNYSVSLVKNPGPNVGDPEGGTIQPGETKTGTITVGDLDAFTFCASANDWVTVLMGAGSSSLDPRVELHAPNGAVLASEVASFGGSASIHLENLPQDGIYFIVCRSRFGTPTGKYGVSLIGSAGSPPLIAQPPQSQTACVGSPVTFSVTASGSGLTYQWKKNGSEIVGATASSYTIDSVIAADAAGYTVVVSNSCDSVTSAAADLTVQPSMPFISITDDWVSEGDAGTVNATFTVSLSAANCQAVTVDYMTADGTAKAGEDYRGKSGWLTFAPGETLKTITVEVFGDTLVEPDEAFAVVLTGGNAVFVDSRGLGLIANDDWQPPPSLAVTDAAVLEGDPPVTNRLEFVVSLSAVSTQVVTVDYATADGTATEGADYSSARGTLSFAPGQTSQPVRIPIVGDLLDEEERETFAVVLTNAVGAALGKAQGQGTILDNDPLPTLSITDKSVLEGNSATSAAQFTVRLSLTSGRKVTVDYETWDGTAMEADKDYWPTNGTLVFAPGEATKTVRVPIVGDTKEEPDEQYYVELSNPVHATISDAQAVGEIRTEEPPPGELRLEIVWAGEGYRLQLSGESGRSYEVQASTDLINWVELTNAVGPLWSMPLLDLAKPDLGRRFYRAKAQ